MGGLVGAGILALVGVAWITSLVGGFDVVADVDPSRAGATASAALWLGADHMGRDVAWRLITASRAFVGPGLLACLVALATAVPSAAWAGHRGGLAAAVVSYAYTVIGAVPRFVLVLLACSIYGNHPWVLATAAGIAYAPALGEAIEGRIVALQSADFVQATRAHGVTGASLLWYHLIWVNGRRLIARHLLYLFGYTLLLETTLSYIGGFGIEEPSPSWGNMLAFEFGIPDGNPLAWAAPALAIWVVIFGTVLLAGSLLERARA